ncbi:MAG: FAD/NAD(P)-binding protein [Deltaproteobacteria bacterium]|nr:FAD/NAD(P)-binding protein [Deltaproteobacteria bacterium]MBW2307030.1 FAD/NAD(P)-binding protein [Deltaproteobacteria bacterium]
MSNPYIPMPMRVEKVITEVDTRDIKTFRLSFQREEDRDSFQFMPGQFCELSVPGKGESPIGIASSPLERDYVEFTVMMAGVVTTELHSMEPGDFMGIRGPLGNHYPLERLKGKNVVVVGGGFAFTTLRSLTRYMLHPDNRRDFADITVIYGARTPGLLLYKDELKTWMDREDIRTHVTVDPPGAEGWEGHVGFVPTIVEQVAPGAGESVAVVCGPPIMIRFTLPVLLKLGFAREDIVTSLEMRMKCGIGKCGRCNVGEKYVCLHGPVFTLAELDQLPSEY